MKEQEHCISTTVLTVCKIKRHLCIDKTFKSLVCLCIYVTYMLNYAMLNSSQSMQRTLISILQQIPWSKSWSQGNMSIHTFQKGSVSPFSAHSLRIHAMKEQEQEHCISTTVLTVCKNKRLVCIDKSFNFICLYTYVTCVLMYLCHLYAHLCNAWQFTQ